MTTVAFQSASVVPGLAPYAGAIAFGAVASIT